MEPTSLQNLLRDARTLWGEGVPATPENLSAAAVGLASDWYRNTEAVEDHAHANGPWSDEDMLRNNARATAACLNALQDIAPKVSQDEVEARLRTLLDELVAMLPNQRARRLLRREKGNAPTLAALWLEANGIGNWMALLTNSFGYPRHWWGAPGFASIVDAYCSLTPGPPEPETFHDRLVIEPWTLSDAQAGFVCDHRYEVGHS